jgi:signal transduction histidine kinase
MSALRVSARAALAGSLLVLVLLACGAAAAGYLIDARIQQSDRDGQTAAVRARVEQVASSVTKGLTGIETQRRLDALVRRIAPIPVTARLTVISPTSRSVLYSARAVKPTSSDRFSFADGSGRALALALAAPSLDQTPRLLVALASGLAALLAGTAILLAAASRWLLVPLRRLNEQVEAIAGGDPIESPARSPIREVEHVAAAVEGMAAALARTAEHEARLDAGRRLLVSSIAHDLRTPLFSLRAYLDAIAAGIGDPHERLEQARSKAGQIDRLVTSLFDYARADIDRRPQPQATDLVATVNDTAAALDRTARESGVSLRVAALASPTVTINRAALERALTSVLDNALRHTPRGGAVDVTCGEDPAGAFIEVVDDGPGIAADLLPDLFEPILRRGGAGNGRAYGAGLGLAIAARLLRNEGGAIAATNVPDRGASLTLRIPPLPPRAGAG